MADESSLPQDILDAVSKCFCESPEKLARLLYFLLSEENIGKYIRVLRSVINNGIAFKSIVEKLADDVDHLETDADYHRVMADVWNNYLKPNEKTDVGSGQHFDIQLFLTSGKTEVLTTIHFVQTLSRLPPSTRAEITNLAISLAEATLGKTIGSALRQTANNALKFTKNTSGQLVGVGLATVFLAYDILKNIHRWWKNEITGARCGKIVVDSFAGLAGGFGGGLAGSAIGAVIAPGIGLVIGGIVGGIAAGSVMGVLSDWITQKIFNLPKQEALENAYRFLELSYGASNDQINSSFRHMALQYHPDKGGTYEKWHQLQFSMGLIKVSKGEI